MADVFANNRQILHSGDGLTQVSGPPDVCKTPSPGGPVPIPYPNAAMDSDLASGTKKVKINGNPVAIESSNLSTSTGDEAGTAGGGIASNTTKGKLTWGGSSGDVVAEGSGVVRFMEVTQHNGNMWNTVLVAGGEPTVPSYGDDPLDSPDCPVCTKPKSKHKLENDKALHDLCGALAKELKGDFQAEQKKLDDGARQLALDADEDPPPYKKGYMIGVLVCRCPEQKKYAGISTGKKGAEWNGCKAAFEAAVAKVDGGMKALTGPPPRPPYSSNFRKAKGGFGQMSKPQWQSIHENATRINKTFPKSSPPILVCAAPKMIQECLKDGHKPLMLLEMWVSFQSKELDEGVNVNQLEHVTIDFTTGQFNSPQVKRETLSQKVFKDGEAVPSCTTCQVCLTGMLCNLGEPPCP